MARAYRLQGEGLLYHITSRGDGRKDIFHNDTDCVKFIEYLKAVKDKYKVYVYAYCLMANHYHLLLETSQPNISRAMQQLNTAYTVYYNVKRGKTGHLFQGRYKSVLVDKDNYLLELTRYIHLNPVKAKIVDSPEKYPWSSYNEYIKTIRDGMVDKDLLFRYLKINSAGYKKFVLEGIGKKLDPFADIYGGFILGKETFVKDIFRQIKEQVKSEEFAYKGKVMGEVEPAAIVEAVAKKHNTSSEILYKAKKKSFLARKLAIYLLKKHSSLTNKEIGEMFGLTHHTAVGKVSQSVERLVAWDRGVARSIKSTISHFRV